jgi:hypothetical protein
MPYQPIMHNTLSISTSIRLNHNILRIRAEAQEVVQNTFIYLRRTMPNSVMIVSAGRSNHGCA